MKFLTIEVYKCINNFSLSQRFTQRWWVESVNDFKRLALVYYDLSHAILDSMYVIPYRLVFFFFFFFFFLGGGENHIFSPQTGFVTNNGLYKKYVFGTVLHIGLVVFTKAPPCIKCYRFSIDACISLERIKATAMEYDITNHLAQKVIWEEKLYIYVQNVRIV